MNNKKRIYIQDNTLIHILSAAIGAVILAGFGLGLYACIKVIIDTINGNGFYTIVFIAGIVFMWAAVVGVVPTIGAESIIIFMDNDKVWMNKEIAYKNERIQYKSEIRFEDITNMKFMIDNRDSRGRSISSMRGVSLKKYLVLMDENGKEKRFFVQWYTNKYLFKIMTEIVARIEAVGKVYSGASPQEVIDNYKQTERKKLL